MVPSLFVLAVGPSSQPAALAEALAATLDKPCTSDRL
jgi:hypothetical protein